jgi:hypothetical protein
MHELRIKHFKTDNPDLSFPWFRSLDKIEGEELFQKLLKRHEVFESKSLADLVILLWDKKKPVDDMNAEDKNFDLAKVVNSIGIEPNEKVFISWSIFEVDQVHFTDLVKYFDDFWYPSSDDIEIFDSTQNWVIFVDHGGNLFFKKADDSSQNDS